ncbi:MAG: YHS domain-containing protein [Pirellulaceae bacterium]|nr:YHS domain-containing protein [Pirellulaceae bacterium]
MIKQLTPTLVRLYTTLFAVGILVTASTNSSLAQEIKYEDRMGSNKDFDMCEGFRFKQITQLVNDGKISQQQGYNIWKRIQSDKEAVKQVLGQAVVAKELTQDQADRLLPLLDVEMTYVESQHGWFGKPKPLSTGTFQPAEVSAANRNAVYQRLMAANERGDMYDYDVASIMNQLYAGFDSENATVEAVAKYRGALNPRIAQSGSQSRVLQSVQMQRARNRNGYDASEIKISDPADWIKNLENPIYSGPQPGENAPAFQAINLRGEQAGHDLNPVELAGDKLHLMFFVPKSRTFGRFLGQLRQQLQAIEKNSKQTWAMSVIVCTDDANEAEKTFAVLDQRYPENLIVTLSKDGSAGPPSYGLDKNLTATVIVVKDGKVTHNLPYVGNAFYTQPHILGAIGEAMGVDHETLRKYIAGTSGDAATAASNRGMRGNRGNSTATPQKGFRKRLAPLVINNTITRAEAGELMQLSGDENALQKKVDELVKAEKLTAEEAQALLAKEPAEPTQPTKLDSVKCPVMTSRDVKRDFFTTYQGGKVFFCCKNCLAKFEANPEKFQATAKQQMALTGQAREKSNR